MESSSVAFVGITDLRDPAAVFAGAQRVMTMGECFHQASKNPIVPAVPAVFAVPVGQSLTGMPAMYGGSANERRINAGSERDSCSYAKPRFRFSSSQSCAASALD